MFYINKKYFSNSSDRRQTVSKDKNDRQSNKKITVARKGDIVTAPPVNSFKNRLDKFCSTQKLKYYWQIEITGTGSRSEVR